MLKQNVERVDNLESSHVVSDKLAAALRGEGTEAQNAAVNASGGGAAAWKDSIGQVYHIVGFDLIESEVRIYKRERPREFERLSRDSEVLVADGYVVNSKGENTQTPLGEYVMRPISYVAALVTGGDRSSISVTALQSAVRNKYDETKLKGKTVLKMSAPTPGDFVAQYGEQLMEHDIELLDYQEKSGRFTTKICIFGEKAEESKK